MTISFKQVGAKRANPHADLENNVRLEHHEATGNRTAQVFDLSIAAGDEPLTGYTFGGEFFKMSDEVSTPNTLTDLVTESFGRVNVYPKTMTDVYPSAAVGNPLERVLAWHIGENQIDSFQRLGAADVSAVSSIGTATGAKVHTFALTENTDYTFDVDGNANAIPEGAITEINRADWILDILALTDSQNVAKVLYIKAEMNAITAGQIDVSVWAGDTDVTIAFTAV